MPLEIWENAGNSALLSGVANGPTVRARLARVKLDQPGACFVQFTTDSPSMRTGSVLRGIISWQLAGAAHEAEIDIGRGSSCVVGAADAVELTAELTPGAGTASVTVRGSVAPISAPGSQSPRVSFRAQTVAAGVAITGDVPACAKRFSVMLLTTPNQYPNLDISLTAGGTAVAIRNAAPDEWLSVGSNATGWSVFNNTAGPLDVVPIFELQL